MPSDKNLSYYARLLQGLCSGTAMPIAVTLHERCSKKQFYFVKGVDSHIKIIITFVRNNKRVKNTAP